MNKRGNQQTRSPRNPARLKASTSLGVDSQGSIALSADRQYLFAVNVGSHDISSFAFVNGGMRLVGTTPPAGRGR
jgi:hypothetical protein